MYRHRKGLSGPKVHKADQEKLLEMADLQRLLKTVAELKWKRWKRDHAAIFFGFFLALRISEAVLLSRETFRHLEYGQLYIRTSKSGRRVSHLCPGCMRKYRLSAEKIGKDHKCTHCGVSAKVRQPANYKPSEGPPEMSPPVVETIVQEYAKKYLAEMRPDQTWLFESAPGERLSTQELRTIFNAYVMKAGLNPKFSYHSLRHGRGSQVADEFKDVVMVRDTLRQKSLQSAEWYMHLSSKSKKKYRGALDELSKDLDLGV